MLRKEFRDTALRFSESMLGLIAIPIAYFSDKLFVRFGWDFFDVFEFVAIGVAVLFSAYSGATIFQSEKKDRAFEYLFSLPKSRLQILTFKILPRLFFFTFIFVLLILMSGPKTALTVMGCMVVLFCISCSLSLPINSIILSFIGAGLFFQLYSLIAGAIFTLEIFAWRKHIIWYNPKSHFPSLAVAALILLLPLYVAFWKSLKGLDLKPIKFHLKPYFTIALPAVLLSIAFIIWDNLYFIKWWYKHL